MASAQDLRKRIKSVTNTQQITKAMKMVASARLRRAQAAAQATMPYANQLRAMLQRVSTGVDATGNLATLLTVRPVKRTCYVLIGADKGLAGAYTSNVLKFFCAAVADRDPSTYDIVAVGRKPYEYCKAHKLPVKADFHGFSDKPGYADAEAIAENAVQRYMAGDVDEVVLIFTHFINSLSQEVQAQRLLPFAAEATQDMPLEKRDYLFASTQEEILEQLIPVYLKSAVFNGLLQAAASELGSRMTAMTSATDNAGELIGTLNLEYNKLRQAGITNEISEIVGGANALQ